MDSWTRFILPLGALSALAISLVLPACSADESAGEPLLPHPGVGGSGTGGVYGTGGYKPWDAGSDLGQEKEVESSYEYPAATGHYVWVANPLSGRVAYIDGSSLQVKTTQAGNGPTWLSAVPDANLDVAIVINALSADATLLRADKEGNIDTRELKVAQGNNSWAIEAQGKWAISWSDYRKAQSPPSTEGFQDIAVLRLVKGQESSTRLSVGYRPVAVRFSADALHAYAVTQDGVSVIDLQGVTPSVTKLVALSDDPLEDPGSRDVSITPDGTYALVRREGSEKITIVALDEGTRTEIALSGPVTDLDLSPAGNRAIAVVRDQSEAVILHLPEIVSQPNSYKTVTVEQAVIGSVAMAAQADVALLYSNAAGQQRITRLDYALEPPTATTLKLHAPVLAVFLSLDGAGAVILHDKLAAEDAGASALAPGAFSVLKTDPSLPAKLQATQAPPLAVAISTSGAEAIVAERDDVKKVYGAYLIKVATQRVDRYEFSSPPISVGILGGANRAFVAQKHPEGRVSFLDLDTGQARTLTGFELGARVVDGAEGK